MSCIKAVKTWFKAARDDFWDIASAQPVLFTLWVAAVTFLILAATSTVTAQSAPEDPNLLVVVLDDWGLDRFDKFHPDTSARTPILSFIADHSVLFSNTYSQPVCSPTRAEILLGVQGPTTGIMNGFPWPDWTDFVYPEQFLALPAYLDRLGYSSSAIGKWHLTSPNWPNPTNWPNPNQHPCDVGFDLYSGCITNFVGSWSYTDYEYTLAIPGQTWVSQRTGYATSDEIDDAVALINTAPPHWFVWLALHAPHSPWHAPPQELVSVPVETLQTTSDRYDAMLEAADTELFRLLTSIDLSNVVLVVLGDNGTPSQVNGKNNSQKGTVGQGGIRVPLMVWYEGITPRVEDDLVSTVDLHATLIDMAGGLACDSPQGQSLLPTLETGVAHTRQEAFAARKMPIGFGPYDLPVRAAVIKDQWKLTNINGQKLLYLLAPFDIEVAIMPPYAPNEQAAFDELSAKLLAWEG